MADLSPRRMDLLRHLVEPGWLPWRREGWVWLLACHLVRAVLADVCESGDVLGSTGD
jgi:hypothetical protein